MRSHISIYVLPCLKKLHYLSQHFNLSTLPSSCEYASTVSGIYWRQWSSTEPNIVEEAEQNQQVPPQEIVEAEHDPARNIPEEAEPNQQGPPQVVVEHEHGEQAVDLDPNIVNGVDGAQVWDVAQEIVVQGSPQVVVEPENGEQAQAQAVDLDPNMIVGFN